MAIATQPSDGRGKQVAGRIGVVVTYEAASVTATVRSAAMKPLGNLHFTRPSDASRVIVMERAAIKRIVLVLVWILPLLIQNCSFDLPNGTGETISVGILNGGKVLSRQIDIDDDHRHAIASPLPDFDASPTSASSIAATRRIERTETMPRAENRPIYQRTSVLLI
jgi:hypothetical protein